MLESFIVISGLPGSGKSTLGRRLAQAVGLTLLDKDDILEQLFEARGLGDAAWRRALSRESDGILARDASRLDGAVVTSFWRLPGMADDSGTPTDWLHQLANPLVNVHCAVAPELAARRFVQRRRHPGHLDDATSYDVVLESIRELSARGMLDIARRIVVDTSVEPPVEQVVEQIHATLMDR